MRSKEAKQTKSESVIPNYDSIIKLFKKSAVKTLLCASKPKLCALEQGENVLEYLVHEINQFWLSNYINLWRILIRKRKITDYFDC